MAQGQRKQFLQGLAGGAIGTLVGGGALVFALSHYGVVAFTNERVPSLDGWFEWATLNLGSSIPVFAGLLLAFFYSLSRLRRLLDESGPLERIVQLDHLTDTWTTLFFGTGVIWTAIGMRSALIYALGDPDVSVQEGAFKMLERMVEGGILLALSTTIFGGIGGYLMRVYKAIVLGTRLQARYDQEARADVAEMRLSLDRIERFLRREEQEYEL